MENGICSTIVGMSAHEACVAGTAEGADFLGSDMEAALARLCDAPTIV